MDPIVLEDGDSIVVKTASEQVEVNVRLDDDKIPRLVVNRSEVSC